MNWKEKLDEAVRALKSVAESDTVKQFTAKARETADVLVEKAKTGAANVAELFNEANADPTALKIRYLNADISIVAPSDNLEIKRPQAGTLVINDGAGNGLVIAAAGDKAYVSETVGNVNRLTDNTYDLGDKDDVNVIVLKG